MHSASGECRVIAGVSRHIESCYVSRNSGLSCRRERYADKMAWKCAVHRHLPKDQAEGVYIAPRIGSFATIDFRCHIPRRARNHISSHLDYAESEGAILRT